MTVLVVDIEALVMCAILIGILFCANLPYWKSHVVNTNSGMYFLAFILVLMRIIAFLVDGCANLITINYVSNIVYLIAINLLAFSFAVYCSNIFPKPLWNNSFQKFLWVLPCIITTIIFVCSPITHSVFYVNEQGYYQLGSLFEIQCFAFIYLVVVSCIGLHHMHKTQVIRESKKYRAAALFAVPPLILGIIQLAVPTNSLDLLCFGVCISLLMQFVVTQDTRITTDPLTRLPNRQSFDIAINENVRIKFSDSKRKLYLIAIDLNCFKSINDTYGHAEGDNALILAADVLYHVASSNGATAFRIGGDEFEIMVDTEDPELPERIAQKCIEEFDCIDSGGKFVLGMSYGIAEYAGNEPVADFILAADNALYENKRATYA